SFDASDSRDADGQIKRFGDGTEGRGRQLNHTFSKQGDYQVILTVIDNDGAENTSSQKIVVKPPNRIPTPAFIIAPNGGKAPLKVTFNGNKSRDSDGKIDSYLWKFSGGNKSNLETKSGVKVKRTYKQAGTHQIELTITDDDGVAASITKQIIVKAPNRPPLAKLKATPVIGPAPLKVSFDASDSRDADGQIKRFGWDLGDKAKSKQPRLTHTFAKQGTYTVSLTVTDNDGAKKSINQQIIVESPKGVKSNIAAVKPGSKKLVGSAKPEVPGLNGKKIPQEVTKAAALNRSKPDNGLKNSKSEIDEDRFLQVRMLMRAGAPKLALSILDKYQPGFKNQDRWIAWEKQRLGILSDQKDWEAILKRVKSHPKRLPTQFSEQAHEQLVEAYLQLGKGNVARQLLSKKLANSNAKPANIVLWRISLIHSYLREGLVDEARSAMDKMQAKFKPTDKAWRELYARLLIYSGEVTKALAIISDLDTHEAQFLVLLARLRGNSVPIKEVIEQSRKLEKKARKRPDIHSDVLQLIAEAAEVAAATHLQVNVLERFLASRTLDNYVELFDFDLDDLWHAYLTLAKVYGAKNKKLNTTKSAFKVAGELGKGSPITARAIYAFIVSKAKTQSQRAKAHHAFAQYLLKTKRDDLAFAIYGDKKRFPSFRAIPAEVRYLLSERAIFRGDVKTAANLVKGLEVGPPGMDPLDWSLRRARLELYTGNYDKGAEMLEKIVAERKRFDEASSDKMLQPLFDLQAVGKTRAALDLFKLLFDRVESDKHKREILLWIAEAYESESDLQRAAEYYLRSAVYHSRGFDDWGQSARFRAAETMAKAGLIEDARRIYLSLMAASEDAQRKAILERRVQQLWIADAAPKKDDAIEKKADVVTKSGEVVEKKKVTETPPIVPTTVTPTDPPVIKKAPEPPIEKPVVKIKPKKVKVKSSVQPVELDEIDEGLLSN
ncbi:PKD domain-containing protein, partial [Pseudomonadota bacterium]